MHRIEAGLLIPGRGEPVSDGVVILDGGRISYAGPAADAPQTPQASQDRAVAVLPGLWDCHGHFLGTRTLDLGRLPLQPLALRAARCARDLRERARRRGHLRAGGRRPRGAPRARRRRRRTGRPGHLRRGRDPLHHRRPRGPALLSPALGEDFARLEGTMCLADGEAECMRAAREQLRRGARLIKVCASGGVLSELDSPIHQQFTARGTAGHRGGRGPGRPGGGGALPRQARHHGRASRRACKRSSTAATWTRKRCDAMLANGTILVPTRSIIEDILAHLGAVPPYAAAKLPRSPARTPTRCGWRSSAASPIAMGTDIGADRHGPAELLGAQRVRARAPGDPRHDAAAVDRGRYRGRAATLGPQAPRSGQLAAGYDADIITLDADPAGRHLGAGAAGAHHRRLDGRAPGQGGRAEVTSAAHGPRPPAEMGAARRREWGRRGQVGAGHHR